MRPMPATPQVTINEILQPSEDFLSFLNDLKKEPKLERDRDRDFELELELEPPPL